MTRERGVPGIVLGDRVRFTHVLRRRSLALYGDDQKAVPGSYVRYNERKFWQPEHAPYGRHGGIVVGRRTLANGLNTWEYEAGTHFTPTERFRAYLVSWHLDKRPVLVLPDHLEYVDTVTVPRPTVPHGPVHLTVDEADAAYFREASRTLESRRAFGSNLTRTIARLLDDVAAELAPPAPDQQETLTDGR